MKTEKRTNHRVEVGVKFYSQSHEEAAQHKAAVQEAGSIREAIIRHVDGCTKYNVNVEWDTEEVCWFCKSKWETETDGTPVCCIRAADEFLEQKGEQPKVTGE